MQDDAGGRGGGGQRHPAHGPAKQDAFANIRGLPSMRSYDLVFHVAADYRLWVPDPEMLYQVNVPFYFGGTGLLIVVGVMLDTMRQIESHLLTRHYDGFLKRGKIRGRF